MKKIKFKDFIIQKLKESKFIKEYRWTPELAILAWFVFLFLILIIRLFSVQIIHHKHYSDILNSQHTTQSSLQADRWSIFVYDKSNNPVKLTENISMYNIYVDPKYIDKSRLIELLTPIVYEHLCVLNGMNYLEKIDCIKNIENFSLKDLLPEAPDFFYMGNGIVSEWYYTYDWTWYNEQIQSILDNFTTWTAETLIKNWLDRKIQIWIKEQNYLWFFSNEDFIYDLTNLDLPFIEIKYKNYVYVIPSKVSNISKDESKLNAILKKYWYAASYPNLDKYFTPQENRYVKIVSNVNPTIAQKVKDLKSDYYDERTWAEKIPILHWLWLETFTTRYYPYGSFLSNILWYVDKNGEAFYGIEKYFDEELRGKNWKIIWRSSAWIWWVWANDFEIENVVNWDDIYLTIDIGIQKEIESIVKKWQQSLKADSISVLVYDPTNWQIKASAQYPTFNPNDYNDAYTLQPLSVDYAYIIDSDTYMDIPVYIKTWWQTRTAISTERTDVEQKKYIAKNIYWPQVFVDKNIWSAYEPWSVFKAFTVALWLDSDEISLYDFYNDPGEVKVWQYTIKNADNKNCMGEKTFMNAFVFSCNIGMVRIVQAVWKNNFYNYLNKLWFGKLTDIELAGEVKWTIDDVTSVSVARFLNNAFGQWLLATPLQIAAAYWALVNGWYYIKPTILAWYYNPVEDKYYENQTKIVSQIFRPETAEQMKNALFTVMEMNPDYIHIARVEWKTLGWKSWTAQIAYKWKYMQWNWWTNWSFVWLITKENPSYIVVVQVRRPRATLWWAQTAWKVFSDVANFLLDYSFIEK